MSGGAALEKTRILLIEDDPPVAMTIKDVLESEGYEVRIVKSGSEAKSSLEGPAPDLIVLDLMLPDVDGLILCADLKARLNVPIIICSATNRKRDTVLGLKLGADDFISKPFNIDEFVTRVEAVLRRRPRPADVTPRAATATAPPTGEPAAPAAPPVEAHIVGALRLEHARRRVQFASEEVQLTPTEYRLLATFMSRPDEVLSRQELAQIVWGYEDASIGRSIDVHVHRLRSKLQAAEEKTNVPGPTIVSVRGFGYKLLPHVNAVTAA